MILAYSVGIILHWLCLERGLKKKLIDIIVDLINVRKKIIIFYFNNNNKSLI
jgi:hypothetical protein